MPFLHLESLGLGLFLFLFSRVHHQVHFLSCVRFFLSSGGKRRSSTSGDWMGQSLHFTVLLAEGSAACPLQNLLSGSCSGPDFPPFPLWLSEPAQGRDEASSLWLITWPVFLQLCLGCAALIMGLFLAAAGETLQLTQAPSSSSDLPS